MLECLPTSDPRRCVAVRLDAGDAGEVVVYGTVLPWNGDVGADPKRPARGWEEFPRVVGVQGRDWTSLRTRHPSAALDGDSRWKQFIHVTLPSLRPTILFTVVVSTIGASQVFGEPLLFDANKGASGGAEHQFQTLGLYLYEQGWINQHLGRASAIAWTMFAILIVIGIINQLISRRLRASS